MTGEIIAAAAYVLASGIVALVARSWRRSLDANGSLAERVAELVERTGNGADPGLAARLAELEAQVAALRRDVNDIDERAEARYRRLTARARRAGDTDDDDIFGLSGGARPAPPSSPTGQQPRRRLRRL